MNTLPETPGSAVDQAITCSVIIVAYNSVATLPFCLNSIPPTAEVIVVDQDSSDNSATLAHQLRPNANVIRAGANRGFGAGCNLGAANANGTVLLFLNPDAALATGALDILVDAAVKENALVGPTITDTKGNDKTQARNSSTMLIDLTDVFWPQKLAVGALARDIPKDRSVYKKGGPVPYVQGSCMAIKTETFRSVGGFDERYFLYYEEESLARSLAEIGVSVKLEPSAVVTHIGKVSTSQAADFSVIQLYRSKALFYRTYHSPPRAFLFNRFVWALLHIMAIMTPVRMAVGLKPDQDRGWFRAAAEGISSGCKRQIVVPPKARPNVLPSN